MILKGSQRAGGKQLARHLLKTEENEHVAVHEVRGFMAEDLNGALHEAYAVSRGTRAKQFLFSLSLNPPQNEKVPIDVFEAAIETVEERLGLEGQPRAIVFHEKEGRRHAHAVWSRIDTEEMKAINLPHYKFKLREISKELYLEHGWQMPRGLVDSKERDPANFTREQWQQARRGGHDPRALRSMFQECWAISDSKKAFAQALQARGYHLARGDKRGYVAVDYRGEVYAISKYAGVKTKDVRARLGDANELPSIEETKGAISARMSNMLRRHIQEAEAAHRVQSASLTFRKNELVQRQREERARLERSQEERRARETLERTQRISKGFRGLWDRLTGKHAEIKRRNELETLQAYHRDRNEKQFLIGDHLDERQALQKHIATARQNQTREVAQLHRDIANYMRMTAKDTPDLSADFRAANPPERTFDRGLDRSDGPERDL